MRVCRKSELRRKFQRCQLKRFMFAAADASPRITPQQAREIGRFSGSQVQSDDLCPVQSMLEAHTLHADRLPAIYAGEARVERLIRYLAIVESEIERASRAAAHDASRLHFVDGFTDTFAP